MIRLFAELSGHYLVSWCDLTPQGLDGFRHCVRLGMGLLPKFRGRGIGAALLSHAIAEARKMGYEKIELEVFASNLSAIHLYTKNGFDSEGNRVRARKIDGRYDDVLLFGLFL